MEQSIKHIAFIMDGNGRWAKKRGLPREYGHKVGAETFKKIAEYCGDIGIKIVTVYAFSTENWKRPEKEVNAIFELFSSYLDLGARTMMKKDIHIVFLGDRTPFSDGLKKRMSDIETRSAGNSRTLNIAINYGGRDDIVHAVNKALQSGKTSITEEDISSNLYTADCPEPDLVVRTANEYRLSNFMVWQSAYSELYFTDVLWPDMTPADVDKAIEEYNRRTRRYGGL